MSAIIVIVFVLFAPPLHACFVATFRAYKKNRHIFYCVLFVDWNIFSRFSFIPRAIYYFCFNLYTLFGLVVFFRVCLLFLFVSFHWQINANHFTTMSGWLSRVGVMNYCLLFFKTWNLLKWFCYCWSLRFVYYDWKESFAFFLPLSLSLLCPDKKR